MSTEQLRQILAGAEGGPNFLDDPLVARADFDNMLASLPTPEGIIATPHDLAGVPGLRIAPVDAEATEPALLYLHGGAFVGGSAQGYIGVLTTLAQEMGRPVHAIDYRLVPEATFPAPVDDAVIAFKALAEEVGGASRLAVAGDSAGGGLALALMVALRDAGDPLPATAVLLSPWTDMTCSGSSMTTHVDEDPVLTPEGSANAARNYLNGADPKTPTASPLFADFTALPSFHVHVGSREILLDDSTQLARHDSAHVKVWDGMVHDWCLFWFALDEAREVLKETAAAVLDAIKEKEHV
jgi:epsilon-lactone hydrolase